MNTLPTNRRLLGFAPILLIALGAGVLLTLIGITILVMQPKKQTTKNPVPVVSTPPEEEALPDDVLPSLTPKPSVVASASALPVGASVVGVYQLTGVKVAGSTATTPEAVPYDELLQQSNNQTSITPKPELLEIKADGNYQFSNGLFSYYSHPSTKKQAVLIGNKLTFTNFVDGATGDEKNVAQAVEVFDRNNIDVSLRYTISADKQLTLTRDVTLAQLQDKIEKALPGILANTPAEIPWPAKRLLYQSLVFQPYKEPSTTPKATVLPQPSLTASPSASPFKTPSPILSGAKKSLLDLYRLLFGND